LIFLATRRWTPEKYESWEVEQKKIHIDLLKNIALYLGYEFDKTHLKTKFTIQKDLVVKKAM